MEAVEADRKGSHADTEAFNKYYDCVDFNENFERQIKDTIEDELADSCIRLLDLAGLRGYDLNSFDYEGSDTEDYSDMSFTESMFEITKYLTDGFYKYDPYTLLNEVFAFCKTRNVDIMYHIELKIKYNELRPYKHGDKNY